LAALSPRSLFTARLFYQPVYRAFRRGDDG
jgi:hypothetical protein